MKALIVDDERIARQELRRLLIAHPEIEIAAEAQNGEQALDLIPKLAADVIFLDIQMPEMTGFELLTRLDDVPQIIFTTAYDQYAIRAFEVSALDYLLKPIAPNEVGRRRQSRKLRIRVKLPSTAGTSLRPRRRALLAGSRSRHLSARIGRQLHPGVLQRRTPVNR